MVKLNHQRVTLLRWLAILKILRANEYPNKPALAQHFGCDTRTIQRDLAVLRRDFNAPIRYDRDQGGFYLSDKAWRLDG